MTHRCLVQFKIGGYEDNIWCDVIPMNITHILLERPWIYDRKVCNNKEKHITFLWKGRWVSLVPLQPTTSPSTSSPTVEELKKEQIEEIDVIITQKELPTMRENIKVDIEKQDLVIKIPHIGFIFGNR